MRANKFRGKRKDNGKWITGDLCQYMRGQSYCIMPDSYFATKDFGEEDDKGSPILEQGMAIGEWFTVITETVGQFTGLLDNNGKEIYEGDVIQASHFEPLIVGYTMDKGAFVGSKTNSFKLDEIYNFVDDINPLDKWEIIGNIQDNPELLK